MDTIPEILAVGEKIVREKRLDHLLITLGSRGMVLFGERDTPLHIPTVARKVYDVTGAGDTVIAVLALCLSGGVDLLTSCVIANCAAGFVVGQVGTAAVRHKDLVTSLETSGLPRISTWTA
jgi:bifunctional ADP-heptose synthase (sugar kinase/adenylyltransferase)